MALTINHQTNEISNDGVITVGGVAVGGNNGPLAFFGTRGIFAGGRDINGTKITSIEYITVATLGNASSFGNLTEAKGFPTGLQGT